MANEKDIQPLKIKELFSSNDEYTIPIYQRNYAWQKAQIEQLIQDIVDFAKIKTNIPSEKKKSYYIGTLVVFERKENNKTIYETIDGQQRLTTLSILLSVLKNHFVENLKDKNFILNHLLSYESRKSSNRTFKTIYNHTNFTDDCNSTMKNAYEIINAKLNTIKDNNELNIFIEYLLNDVEILRVNVPEDTDLNHYFEIMNNRGEQLEKHEVLKSQMLSKLNENERVAFSTIWDACSDMSRYVQYGFSTDDRTTLFGEKWNILKISSFENIVESFNNNHSSNKEGILLEEIINSNHKFNIEKSENDKISSERFISPINFQNFLLHVLRIIVNSKNQEDIALDDKRLIDSFNPYLSEEFVKDFGYNLLKLRYLFDNYIIKRDYSKDSEDGEWSLLRAYKYTYGNQKSIQYNNSFSEETHNKQILMLLAMFHVSNPSQIYKHWVSGVLDYLFKQDINNIDPIKYINYLEDLAKKFLKRYLSVDKIEYNDILFSNTLFNPQIDLEKLNQGTSVENFIFNYLDYLLWIEDKNNNYKKFSFTFRSSVEHFYPQNPLDGQGKLQDIQDKDYLNNFGNLCLISASKNSKFTNLQPEGKKSHYHIFDGVSPKQYIMMSQAHSWWIDEILKHQEEMIKILGLTNDPK